MGQAAGAGGARVPGRRTPDSEPARPAGAAGEPGRSGRLDGPGASGPPARTRIPPPSPGHQSRPRRRSRRHRLGLTRTTDRPGPGPGDLPSVAHRDSVRLRVATVTRHGDCCRPARPGGSGLTEAMHPGYVRSPSHFESDFWQSLFWKL